MRENKLQKASTFAVFTYTFVYMLLTLLYCLPRILAEYSTVDMSHISETFSIPLDIFAWGLLAICAGYSVMDRAEFAKKSSLMEIGQTDAGDIDNLKKVIVCLIFVFLETEVLNLFLSHPFTVVTKYGKQVFNGIDLPVEGIATAIVSTVIAYVNGNKFISYQENNTKEDKNEKTD